jgi:enoyl-CoA hydratase/carnithine racemase
MVYWLNIGIGLPVRISLLPPIRRTLADYNLFNAFTTQDTSEWSTNKMESLTNVLFEVREHVAHITLNRPEVSNAMNLEMAREFYEAAFECEQSSDVRAVLITGAGRAFCSGGDVKSFAAQEPGRLPAYYRRLTLAATADVQEGIAAFLAKRPPQFNGR